MSTQAKNARDEGKKLKREAKQRERRDKRGDDVPKPETPTPRTAVQAPDIRRPRLSSAPKDGDGKEAGSVKAEQSQTDSTPASESEDNFSWEDVEVIGPDQADKKKVGDRFFVDPKCVLADPNQPREYFEEEALEQLAEAIQYEGQLETAKVYPHSDPEFPNCAWILEDGERRKRACEMKELPLLVEVAERPRSETLTLVRQLIRNEHQEGHTHQENVNSIARLVAADKTTVEIARIFGKSEAWVGNYRRLGQLSPPILAMTSPEVPDSERLRLPVAGQVLKFHEEERLDIARQVRGKSLEQASPFINRALGYETPESGGRKRKLSDTRGTFEQTLDRVISRLVSQRRSLDEMTDDQLTRMFANVSSKVRQEVLASLDKVNELTTAIRERIEACLPD